MFEKSLNLFYVFVKEIKNLFYVWQGSEMALIQFGSSCVAAQWGIRRPQVFAVKASYYPTRLESHQDK